MQKINPSVDMSHLGCEWMDILQTQCPPDWKALLPSVNLARTDRLLPANSLPVLSYLPEMVELAPSYNQPLIKELIKHRTKLHFNQTYGEDDFGADFLKRYGWIKFLGPDAYWHSDSLSSGLVLLGDNVLYPEHWHEAEELYFPISGSGDWYHENYGWRPKSPGDCIAHESNVKHAVRTSGEPLLLLYIWRGGDLQQKSDYHKR